jgi:phosphate transporter
MDPALDWLQWFAVSLPVASISVFLIWLLLLVAYQPSRLPEGLSGLSSAEDGEGNYGAVNTLEIKPIRPSKDPFTKKQMFVSFVCVLTIALWCIEHQIETWVGDMGVIALLPVIAFFSTGVLKKVSIPSFNRIRRWCIDLSCTR